MDAVVVDEEAVGSVDAHGCGPKILRGEGAFECFLHRAKSTVAMVFSCWIVGNILGHLYFLLA